MTEKENNTNSKKILTYSSSSTPKDYVNPPQDTGCKRIDKSSASPYMPLGKVTFLLLCRSNRFWFTHLGFGSGLFRLFHDFCYR